VRLHDNGALTLEVSDNGIGFDSNQSFPGHMGLISMSERAANIGARVEVESTPGAGTTIRLILPRDREAKAQGGRNSGAQADPLGRGNT